MYVDYTINIHIFKTSATHVYTRPVVVRVFVEDYQWPQTNKKCEIENCTFLLKRPESQSHHACVGNNSVFFCFEGFSSNSAFYWLCFVFVIYFLLCLVGS